MKARRIRMLRVEPTKTMLRMTMMRREDMVGKWAAKLNEQTFE